MYSDGLFTDTCDDFQSSDEEDLFIREKSKLKKNNAHVTPEMIEDVKKELSAASRFTSLVLCQPKKNTSQKITLLEVFETFDARAKARTNDNACSKAACFFQNKELMSSRLVSCANDFLSPVNYLIYKSKSKMSAVRSKNPGPQKTLVLSSVYRRDCEHLPIRIEILVATIETKLALPLSTLVFHGKLPYSLLLFESLPLKNVLIIFAMVQDHNKLQLTFDQTKELTQNTLSFTRGEVMEPRKNDGASNALHACLVSYVDYGYMPPQHLVT